MTFNQNVDLVLRLLDCGLLYGADAWTMTTFDELALGVFERKVLRKIYGPFRISNGEYRSR